MVSKVIPNNISSFGELVRYLRQEQGLTLRALAREVGVTAPFLSDVEHNRRSTDKIPELAKALGVTPGLLDQYNGRLSSELRGWLAAKPEMVTLLRQIRASGRGADELRKALRFSRRG